MKPYGLFLTRSATGFLGGRRLFALAGAFFASAGHLAFAFSGGAFAGFFAGATAFSGFLAGGFAFALTGGAFAGFFAGTAAVASFRTALLQATLTGVLRLGAGGLFFLTTDHQNQAQQQQHRNCSLHHRSPIRGLVTQQRHALIIDHFVK